MPLKSIESGIYRVDGLSTCSIPGKEVESYQQDIVNILNDIKSRDSLLHPEYYQDRDGYHPKRTFFESSDDFLDAWIEGYQQGETQFGTNKIYEKLGFELKYVNSDPDSDFFQIETEHPSFPHTGIQNERLNPIMLCADANGLYDQNGYMNLGINDLKKRRALIYRGKVESDVGLGFTESIPYSEVSEIEFEKELRNDINYYVWPGKEKFPFSSSNGLKASGKIWHMIGISPIDVYKKLEELSFKFPE